METFFIDCVKKNSLLYDTEDPYNRKKEARRSAFSHILTELKHNFASKTTKVEPHNPVHIGIKKNSFF